MRLLSLKLKNYRQFKDAEVEFADGVTGITGLNGAGKSSLIEAVAWALYGNIISRNGKEGIKRSTASPAADVMVTLTLELAGNQYQITRGFKGARQASIASIISGGKIIADSIKGTEKEINHILGMDYKSFYTSFFAKQKELNALTELSPNQRKDVIIRMLRIDAIDKAIDEIRKDAREKKTETEILKKGLKDENMLEARRIAKAQEVKTAEKEMTSEEKEIKKIEQKLKDFSARFIDERKKFEKSSQLDKEKEKIQVKINSLSTREQELTEEMETILENTKELKIKEKEAKNYEELKTKKEELEKLRESDKDKLNKDLNQLAHEAAEYEAKLKLLREKFKELEESKKTIKKQGPKSVCPTCQRPLGKDFDEILKHLETEQKAIKTEGETLKQKKETVDQQRKDKQNLLDSIDNKKATKTALKYDPKLYQDILKQLEIAEKAKDEYLTIKSIAVKQPKIQAALKEIKQKIKELDTKYKAVTQEIKALAFDEKQHEKITSEYDQTKEILDEKYAERNKINLTSVASNKELEQIEAEIKELQATRKNIDTIIKQQEQISKLSNIMIQYRTHLISRIRPELSQVAGKLFSVLTDNKYSDVELDENYEMFIYEGGNKYSLSRFSGGEADLANLCLRLAISQLISKAAGSEGGFIILDEIFGSQDPIRKNAIMQALTTLSKQYQQIILITHIEDIKDQVENLIEVFEDEQGVSRVKL
ncbi:MAG: SMC family ATPase [Candidatus Margulisbacteria bacterium]|nr:SMC family ATPase [Candidatus Margulisiibacteriota bacterium]MBU1021436.1 SMC family ATPase [Candidatus Margulisiibacteriota bacterium]MBU1728357.1 SMC family ATPase [Candidatus Margulisiibacteriota bacterium]MBU1955900.1 SMC family ATPase [Candidatus Margulisiibacteriota bacterium]